MPNTPAWDRVPVHAWYYKSPGVPSTGSVEFKIVGAPNGVKRSDGRAIYRAGATISVKIGVPEDQDTVLRNVLRAAYRAQAQAQQGASFDGVEWDAAWDAALPAMICTGFYAQNDPDITPQGWQIHVTEKMTSGEGNTGPYPIDLTMSMIDATPIPGINLAAIELPPGTPTAPAPTYAKGQPGGVAALDADGAVVDAFGVKVGTGGGAVDSVAGRDGDVVLSLADIVGLTSALGGKAPNDSPAFTGTVTGITKAMVGLGNVDNTSDANKPVSTAQAAALAAKADLVGGKIPTAQIPAVALGTAVPVANQAAMLALTAAQVQPGDVAVRADGAGTFMLMADDPSVLGNWRLLNAPADAVSSVNSQTGTVVLGKTDVGLENVDNTSDANKPVSTATQTALNEKMAQSALTSMRLSWAAANALSARPTLPAGVPFSIYGATAAQAATPPSWLIDGDWIDVRS